jgi:hypothetical protein
VNDVASTFYAALVDKTDAGEALAALDNRLFPDAPDFAAGPRGMQLGPPLGWLAVDPARALDVMRGSRWQVYEGRIAFQLIAGVPVNPSDVGWTTAREACETLFAAAERVLFGLRSKTSATNPLGCWHDMTFSAAEGEFDAGPSSFKGLRVYTKVFDCRFRFRRYRAVA